MYRILYTDIKLDDCDKHIQTDCENDHSTSKVLGHSDQTINKPYFDLCTVSAYQFNPLTTDDECTYHATLAACYQLAQSVLG